MERAPYENVISPLYNLSGAHKFRKCKAVPGVWHDTSSAIVWGLGMTLSSGIVWGLGTTLAAA